MTYATQLVYLSCRQLAMRPPTAEPFGLIYHAPDHHAYEFATRCGMRHRDRGDIRTVGMRRDTADLIASPCQRCWP